MSGGSYEYLCYKDASEIMGGAGQLEAMRDRLIELGHHDAAKETESIILMREALGIRIQARLDRLQPVWHAVEWYDSGDWGKDDVEREVEKYRNL